MALWRVHQTGLEDLLINSHSSITAKCIGCAVMTILQIYELDLESLFYEFFPGCRPHRALFRLWWCRLAGR